MTPAPSPLASAIRTAVHSQRGFTLPDAALGIAVAMVIGASAWWYFKPSETSAQIAQQQQAVTEAVMKAQRAWGARGTYEGLSLQAMRDDGMLPELLESGKTPWNTPIAFEAVTIAGRTNAGMGVRFDALPARICSRLASSFSDAFHDIRINDTSVLVEGAPDTDAIIEQCAGGDDNVVQFIYDDGTYGQIAHANHELPPEWVRPPIDPANPGTWVQPPSINPSAPCVVPPVQTRDLGCAEGEQGVHLQTRTATCPSPAGAYVWGEWTDGSITCSPVPAGCGAPVTRPATCPTGFSGTRIEQQDCPGGPSESSWYIIANGCYPDAITPTGPVGPPVYAPRCVAPAPTVETRTLVDCPAGQYGTRTEERIRPWFCFDEYSPAEQSPTWTSWRETGNTCSPCPGPATENQTVNTPGPICPAGTTGVRSTDQPQSRTGTYSCPAGTETLPTIVWGGWNNSGPAVVNGTCSPCPAVPAHGSPSSACPSGTTGTRAWSVTPGTNPTLTTAGSCPSAVEVGTCTPCPATPAHGSPAPGTCPAGQGGFFTWVVTPGTNPGLGTSGTCPTTTTTNNCAPCPGPATENQTVNTPGPICPAGTTGVRSTDQPQSRTGTYSCPAGTENVPAVVWSEWTNSGPAVVNGTCSPCPAPTVENRVVTTDGPPCPAGQFGSRSTDQPQSRTGTYSCPAGTENVPAVVWSEWTNSGPAVVNGTCSPCPTSNNYRCIQTPIACGALAAWNYRKEIQSVTNCPSEAPVLGAWQENFGWGPNCPPSNPCPSSCPPMPNDVWCPNGVDIEYDYFDTGMVAGDGCPIYDFAHNSCGSSTPPCPSVRNYSTTEVYSCPGTNTTGTYSVVTNWRQEQEWSPLLATCNWKNAEVVGGSVGGSTDCTPWTGYNEPDPGSCGGSRSYRVPATCPPGQQGYAYDVYSYTLSSNGSGQCVRSPSMPSDGDYFSERNTDGCSPVAGTEPASHCFSPSPLPWSGRAGFEYLGFLMPAGHCWGTPGGRVCLQCP